MWANAVFKRMGVDASSGQLYWSTSTSLSTHTVLTHRGRNKIINMWRRHFQMHHYLEWKSSYFDSNITSEIRHHWFGLTPHRRQSITWTNDDPDHWRIYASLGLKELIKVLVFNSDAYTDRGVYTSLRATCEGALCLFWRKWAVL